VGKRISIQYTRKLLEAALNGRLLEVGYHQDPVFGFEVPNTCEGVPPEILDPSKTWPNRREYLRKYDALAARYIENFKLMEDGCPPEIVQAGPRRMPAAV
jgi:phosphoenolpyruvate carboxykinase (ATP)